MLNCQILNVKILITWEYGYLSKIKRIIKKNKQTNKKHNQSSGMIIHYETINGLLKILQDIFHESIKVQTS